MRIPKLSSLLFPKEGQSRSFERFRRAGLTGLTSVLVQGITIATGFISLPLTLKYLGTERFGIWITINGLLQWLYVSNLGLSGNALINKLSEANGKDDQSQAQELVATAFWSLGGIAVLFSLIFALSFPFINWSWVFNSSSAVAIGEIQTAAAIAFACFVMMFPTSMVDAVYQSYQEGFIGNIWNIAGSIVSLGALIFVTQMEGGLPLLVAAMFGVRMLFSFVNAAYLFFIRHPWLAPNPKTATGKSFRSLFNLGGKYLVAQLSGIGMFQSQPMIITQILGPGAVSVFSIAQRILTLPTTVVLMLTTAFMPAYGEARARGDWGWIKKTFKRTMVAATLGSIAMVLPLCLFAQTIIYYYASPEVVPSSALVWTFGLYVIIVCAVTPASVMLYGLERVGVQATLATLNAILNVGLGIFLTQKFGVTGMGLAMVIAFGLVNPIGQIIEVRAIFKRFDKESDGKI